MARRGRDFLVTDAETDPFKVGRVPKPFIWGLYNGNGEIYDEYQTGAQVCDAVRDRKCTVYAHNGGKFDYHYLRDELNTDDPIMVIGGRLAKFKVGQAEFRDSMNILNEPLAVFQKETIDYGKLEASVRHLHMDEIRRYLRSDCVNLWNTVNDYFGRYGRTLTQAGAAMRYWQEKFEFPFVRQTMQQAARYRDFYYGGRVECFEQGYDQTPFEVADRNSAYPHAMLQKHPIAPDTEIEDHLPPAGQLGPCMIRVEGIAKGCFPWRNPEDEGSLLFPDDERTIREYAITGWELEAALEANAFKIFRVIEVRRFTQLLDFKDYILGFYEMRMEAKRAGDRLGDLFAKRFMNSLYGKFAADPEKYAEYVIANDESFSHWAGKCGSRCYVCREKETRIENPYVRLSSWGDRHLLARPLPEWKHVYYNVATAASITGYVRAGLFKGIMACSRVKYVDTDCIAARDVSPLSIGPELGQWKLEGRFDESAIAGKKLYAWRYSEDSPDGKHKAGEYKTASKGVRLEAPDIIRVAKGETITYQPEVPTYTIHRPPEFVPRDIRMTYKKVAPEGRIH